MTHTSSTLTLDGRALSVDAVAAVARDGVRVKLDENCARRMSQVRDGMLATAATGDALYGINTGFGSFAHVRLPRDQLARLQTNIVRSHAAGVGDPLDDQSVRGMMVVLAASLARGHSGVRPQLVESILAHLNQGLTPLVPSRGSVGASGDLAPLAHIAQGLIGEGVMRVEGRVMDAHDAQRAAGIEPIVLQEKEGLALMNGTHMMAALGALAIHDARNVLHGAVAATAMAMDGCRGAASVLDERIHHVRNQQGQMAAAAALRQLLQNSQIGPSHADNDPRVQDPYSLRASPQVLGAVMESAQFAAQIIENELGAVTDNPLVFESQTGPGGAWQVRSGANFHGMPLAIALDLLKIALCHLAGIAERRIFWALSGHDKENKLPAHLSAQPGVHSGYMIVQYTAAACCNELRTLAHPSSVGNISTCAGIEDYNSMGATSALHARDAIRLTRDVIACELLVMAEAIDYQRPLLSGTGVEHAHHLVRMKVKRLTDDRSPAPDIAAISALIAEGALRVPALSLL